MSINPVVHFEIYVQDMVRAKAFYEAVLQVKLDPMADPTGEAGTEMWAFPMDKETGMSSYGSGRMLVKMPGYPSGNGGGTIVYFGSDDCAVPASRAAAHGGSVVKSKTSIGEHGFFALVQDTEGNMIGFHSMA